MKATTIFLLFMFVAFLTSGQEKEQQTRMLRVVDVKPPVFTGVKAKVVKADKPLTIYDYLQDKMIYPNESEDLRREGTVVVQFTVLTDGTLDDFHIINSVTSELDEEVISLLKGTDYMWRPGNNNGIPVAMEKEVAVTFQIENSDHVRLARNLYKRANKKIVKNKYKRALKLLDYALVYQPYDEAILLKRGMTRSLAGNVDGACDDWNRLKSLGCSVVDEYLKRYCETEGYAINK